MDSPACQPSPILGRARTQSSLSVRSAACPTGIRKQSIPRTRAISIPLSEQLEQLVYDQSNTISQEFQPIPQAPLNLNWLTPQHSPQPQLFPDATTIESFPQWNVPTPPKSDSGIPSLSIDSNDDHSTSNPASSQPFDFGPITTSAEMSSLGFLLPSQYANEIYDSDPSNYQLDQTYPSMKTPPVTSGGQTYGQTIPSSPALYQSRSLHSSTMPRRNAELPSMSSADSSYSSSYRRVSNPYGSATNAEYSMAPGQTIPSISGLVQSPLPSPHLGSVSASTMSQYNTATTRSPGPYDSRSYSQPTSSTPAPNSQYPSNQSMSYPPPPLASNGRELSSRSSGSDTLSKLLGSKPKAQCWEHGCNGRQFSTFSNLLRHQREKSGTASKSYCPRCGAEFTRSTARNGHLAHDKCTKTRQQSEDRPA